MRGDESTEDCGEEEEEEGGGHTGLEKGKENECFGEFVAVSCAEGKAY